jgi:hypothetical protein
MEVFLLPKPKTGSQKKTKIKNILEKNAFFQNKYWSVLIEENEISYDTILIKVPQRRTKSTSEMLVNDLAQEKSSFWNLYIQTTIQVDYLISMQNMNKYLG